MKKKKIVKKLILKKNVISDLQKENIRGGDHNETLYETCKVPNNPTVPIHPIHNPIC